MQYFTNPRRHKHSTPEITEITTKNNPVQDAIYSRVCQMSSSASTTSFKIPPYGKQYLCFQSDGKSDHAAQCVKSMVLNKFIDLILQIALFEQQCVIIKGLLQPDRLKQHRINIEMDQLLSNNEMYGHRCLVKTKKLYTCTGRCDDKNQYKAILEA